MARQIVVTVLLAIGAALVMAQSGAFPGGGSVPRIGVIDTERILLTSARGKQALATLKAAQTKAESEIAGKITELKALEKRVQEAPNSQSRAELSRQLATGSAALDARRKEAQRDLTAKRDQTLQEIDNAVMPVIKTIGKEMGYTLIFRKFESGLIFADEGVDMTNLVIQRLDKK